MIAVLCCSIMKAEVGWQQKKTCFNLFFIHSIMLEEREKKRKNRTNKNKRQEE